MRYKDAWWQSQEGQSDYFGVKIQIAMPRDLTEEDKSVLRKHADAITEELAALTALNDPELQAKKNIEEANIIKLFPTESVLFIEQIPNEYCSRPCCFGKPWFIMTTPKGRIKIGWRKRVISIDWKNSKIRENAEQLFADEVVYPGCPVTKFDCSIHAHGEEKAKAYLKVLLER